MWIIYYSNEDRISQIAYQIDPKVLQEGIKKKTNLIKADGSGQISFTNFLALLGLKGKARVGAGLEKELDTEESYKYSEYDQKIKRVLDYFLIQNNYTLINDKSKCDNLHDIKTLIRIQGMFQPHINGETYSERIANYEGLKKILWTGNCGEIRTEFFTGKKSIRSSTPLQPALHKKNGKIYLDGFSTYSSNENNLLRVTPIFLGAQV